MSKPSGAIRLSLDELKHIRKLIYADRRVAESALAYTELTNYTTESLREKLTLDERILLKVDFVLDFLTDEENAHEHT